MVIIMEDIGRWKFICFLKFFLELMESRTIFDDIGVKKQRPQEFIQPQEVSKILVLRLHFFFFGVLRSLFLATIFLKELSWDRDVLTVL